MKKLIIALATAGIALMLTGCKEEVVREDITRYYDISDHHWDEFTDAGTGNNGYLECTVNFPEITDYVLDQGSVHGYIVFGDGIYPMPYTRWYEINRSTKFDETFTFGYTRGQVHFRYSRSDFDYRDALLPFTFKVVVSGY